LKVLGNEKLKLKRYEELVYDDFHFETSDNLGHKLNKREALVVDAPLFDKNYLRFNAFGR
jgi:hypothetical protein